MTGFLLDTNAWIGLLKGDSAVVAAVRRVGLGELHICHQFGLNCGLGLVKVSELLKIRRVCVSWSSMCLV
jgi:predicted nucleic acid-binding protein